MVCVIQGKRDVMRYIGNYKGEMIDERAICKTHESEKRKFDR